MNATVSSHAEEAAELAVKKVFYILGVDVTNAASVEEFREDLRFSKKLRRIADHGILAVVALIALAIVTVFTSGLGLSLKR